MRIFVIGLVLSVYVATAVCAEDPVATAEKEYAAALEKAKNEYDAKSKPHRGHRRRGRGRVCGRAHRALGSH